MKQNKKRTAVMIGLILIIDLLISFIAYSAYHQNINFQMNMSASEIKNIKIYSGQDEEKLTKEDGDLFTISKTGTKFLYKKTIPMNTNFIRIDFSESKGTYHISDFDIFKSENHQNAMENIKNRITLNDCSLIKNKNLFTIKITGSNPTMVIHLDQTFMNQVLNDTTKMQFILISGSCFVTDILLLLFIKALRKSSFFKGIVKNRKLIWDLAKNDFKTKYAGSFFGVIWAFVQPVVTILLYWFVFQVGLRSEDIGEIPFVLWLIAGLVPWFFFQDALLSITNSLIEYSYLVKKMVFQIDILPIVKIISALFVHLFFIAFAILVFCCMGFIPSLSAVQLIYYLFCSVVLVLALGYATCAIILFFKDLGQIIQIVLQIGMWMTPILWNINILPAQYKWIMELNPMYYIVNGYRDSLITQTWVWEHLDMTINFWLITIALFAFGTYIYKKLKCHFADVL